MRKLKPMMMKIPESSFFVCFDSLNIGVLKQKTI
jgi:hypothetical protein